jgi:hypothetical protein
MTAKKERKERPPFDAKLTEDRDSVVINLTNVGYSLYDMDVSLTVDVRGVIELAQWLGEQGVIHYDDEESAVLVLPRSVAERLAGGVQ